MKIELSDSEVSTVYHALCDYQEKLAGRESFIEHRSPDDDDFYKESLRWLKEKTEEAEKIKGSLREFL